jgi:GNAT superfamily N-acetyltransferase
MTMHASPAALFWAGPVQAVELQAADVPELQRFFETNPEYALAVNGQPPHAGEAQEEFDDLPPPDMPYRGRHLIGFRDDAGALVGFAGVLSDLLADRVWHIGIFIVATALHGTGAAQSFYNALESWMASNGARWLRLGVVDGNTQAQRFWQRLNYREVRQRCDVAMGSRTNTICVLVKPLGTSTLAEYLSKVARDNPDSALP